MTVQGATSVRAGTTSVFTAVLSDGTTTAVQWSVNSVKGGNASIGTIDSSGHYTAPTVLPATPTVIIGAVQSASPSLSANLTVQLVSEVPTPSIASVNVTQHSGQVTFTITGSNFIPGATARIHPQGPGILCCSDLFGGTRTAAGVIAFTVRGGSATASSTVIVSVRNPDVNATESQGFPVDIPFPPPPNLPNVMFDYVAYAVTNLPKHYTDPLRRQGTLRSLTIRLPRIPSRMPARRSAVYCSMTRSSRPTTPPRAVHVIYSSSDSQMLTISAKAFNAA